MSLENAFEMDRRDLLQRALVLLGSTVVLGACATLPEAAAAQTPFALTDAQRATLTALADTIVPVTDTPGALAAGVPAQVETMMARWAAPATRTEMLAGLARIEALGGGFSTLSAQQCHEVLTPHDADALTITAAGGSGLAAFLSGGPRRRDQGYATLRELIVVLYYYSEIGLTQELEWTPIPGRWDPSVPLDANSHAISNGVGGF